MEAVYQARIESADIKQRTVVYDLISRSPDIDIYADLEEKDADGSVTITFSVGGREYQIITSIVQLHEDMRVIKLNTPNINTIRQFIQDNSEFINKFMIGDVMSEGIPNKKNHHNNDDNDQGSGSNNSAMV